MINIVIFSKDRACQLELLLRSLKHFFKEWQLCNISVIYKFTDADSSDGYDLCKKLHPEFEYVSQNFGKDLGQSFKDLTLSVIDDANPLTFFMVDDLLFKDDVSITDPEFAQFANAEDVLCLSLRMSSLIDYCYPINKTVSPPPEILQGESYWDWTSASGDWGYPMSVDGHVFNTEVIKPLVKFLNYSNPNLFESGLAQCAYMTSHVMPQMICYRDNSKIMNIPANRVQDTFANRSGNLVSAEELNKLFLSGLRIKLEPFIGYKNNAPHIELPYEFEPIV
jgi:hypothetical protein